METELTQSLLKKTPTLPPEKQQELLRQVEEFLEGKTSTKTVWEMWQGRLKEIPQEE